MNLKPELPSAVATGMHSAATKATTISGRNLGFLTPRTLRPTPTLLPNPYRPLTSDRLAVVLPSEETRRLTWLIDRLVTGYLRDFRPAQDTPAPHADCAPGRGYCCWTALGRRSEWLPDDRIR